jgi:GT2 family glycosyltransferase
MKIHIIATAYQRPTDLKRLVYDFILQTNENWDLKIIHDGPPPDGIEAFIKSLKDPRIVFDYTHKVNGYWGHVNRQMMLEEVEGSPDDYVLITNDDNQYVKAFVEIFLKNCDPSVGIVYCDTIHNYMAYDILKTKIRVGSIDMGSFIVKLSVAKAVGFNSIVEVADGIYAEDCAVECQRRGLKIISISKALFIHN